MVGDELKTKATNVLESISDFINPVAEVLKINCLYVSQVHYEYSSLLSFEPEMPQTAQSLAKRTYRLLCTHCFRMDRFGFFRFNYVNKNAMCVCVHTKRTTTKTDRNLHRIVASLCCVLCLHLSCYVSNARKMPHL